VVPEDLEILPVVVVTQTFPARPSSIPEIRDFVNRCLAESPLSEQDSRAVARTVSAALLEAAGPAGTLQVSFRILPDHAEVDVLRSAPGTGPGFPTPTAEAGAPGSFASWLAAALQRQGLTREAAARRLGVSVRTVSRWLGGTTEPRLRDLRRIRRVLGDLPFP
jgi:Helix-turn-helix